MGKIDKEKTILVMVLTSVFVLICVYTYFQFYAGEEAGNEGKEMVSAETHHQNPIDIDKHKKEYQERIQKIKDKEVENKVDVNLSLDIFKEDKIASTPTEQPVLNKPVVAIKEEETPQKVNQPAKVAQKVQTSFKQNTAIEELPEQPEIEIPETGFVRTFAKTSSTSAPVVKENFKPIKIPVIVYNDHSIRSGSKLTLRTTTTQKINGYTIPSNTFIYGIATFSGERILVKVASILVDGKAIPVNLVAEDLDGIEGLYAPGKVEQEMAADAANSALNQTSGSLNTPIGSITLGAGKKKVNDPVRHISNKYKLILKEKS